MKNHKFIKLRNCNDINNLNISIDSIECFFDSIHDHFGMKDDARTGDKYNFIRLKTGIVFRIKEPPDIISKLIQR